MRPRFEHFSRERQYLRDVSPATVAWYKQGLHWLGTESRSGADLKDFVLPMRERGLKATGCKNRIRAVNAFLVVRLTVESSTA